MRGCVWIGRAVALAIHRDQIAAHGGGDGVRDVGLLESALGGPLDLPAYAEPDLAALAASYAFGMARDHPFTDGNKRIAAVVAETFVDLNGHRLDTNDGDLVVTFLALAAGEIDEEGLADRFRARIVADVR